jgi:hypothetical protein
MKHKAKLNNVFLVISIAVLIGCGIYFSTQSAIKEGLASATWPVFGLDGLNGGKGVNDYLGNGQALVKAAMADVDAADNTGTPGADMLPRIVLLLTDYQTYLTSVQKYIDDYISLFAAYTDSGSTLYTDRVAYLESLTLDKQYRVGILVWVYLYQFAIFPLDMYNAQVNAIPISTDPNLQILAQISRGMNYMTSVARGLPLISVSSVINNSQPNSSNMFIQGLQAVLNDLNLYVKKFEKIQFNGDLINFQGWKEYDVEHTFLNKYQNISSVGGLNSLLLNIRQCQQKYHWLVCPDPDNVHTGAYWNPPY